jgi:DNA-binding Xre family transcriptional regulator
LSIQHGQGPGQIRIRLRECMDLYEARTGLRIGYADLAQATGLSVATVQSIGSRGEYNATLKVIERLCTTLHVTPAELLEWREPPGQAE